jgi:glyoxylase-like metal-dependent hydrolase (beta-lactamase superfamily II)
MIDGRVAWHRIGATALSLVLALVTLSAAPSARPHRDIPQQQGVRTGDPAKRGLSEADFPRVQQLADGVYSYEQLRSAGDERFTTVSLFVVTTDGVLVADGQGSMAETQRMVDEIAKVTSQPIRHVVIGSDHGDHTAGNAAFPPDAILYAHPTSKAILEAGAARGRGRGNALPAPLPQVEVPDRLTLRLGGREIQILFLGRAHTGGDLSVYLPREQILFMSEAYLNRIFPAMRSAYPTEWVEVLKKAEAMDVRTYVPGHGFVESPEILTEELLTYRRALEQVIAEARRLHAAGVPVEQAVEQARFGDLETWTLRSSQGGTAIRRVYLELDGGIGPSGHRAIRPSGHRAIRPSGYR